MPEGERMVSVQRPVQTGLCRLSIPSDRSEVGARKAQALRSKTEPVGFESRHNKKASEKPKLSQSGRRAGIRTLDPLIKSQLL